MGSIAAFGALDADALGSLADAIERESGSSAVVSLASTCTALWRGQALRLDNGTGPHALKGKLDVLRQECINGLTQKLACEDLRSLLRSCPDLSGFEVDASDARIIASLYLHDLRGASLTSIDLSDNNLRSEGAKALAPAIRDSPSVTSVRAFGNSRSSGG
jgi:hypothetical protein